MGIVLAFCVGAVCGAAAMWLALYVEAGKDKYI